MLGNLKLPSSKQDPLLNTLNPSRGKPGREIEIEIELVIEVEIEMGIEIEMEIAIEIEIAMKIEIVIEIIIEIIESQEEISKRVMTVR